MNRQELARQLIVHEGLKLYPYRCSANKLTIGVGRNIEERGIAEDEALYLLNNDIDLSIKELTNEFAWFEKISETRQAAFIDLHFNMGMNRLLGFKKTLSLVERAVEGDASWQDVAHELLDSRWSEQVGSWAHVIADMIALGDL